MTVQDLPAGAFQRGDSEDYNRRAFQAANAIRKAPTMRYVTPVTVSAARLVNG